MYTFKEYSGNYTCLRRLLQVIHTITIPPWRLPFRSNAWTRCGLETRRFRWNIVTLRTTKTLSVYVLNIAKDGVIVLCFMYASALLNKLCSKIKTGEVYHSRFNGVVSWLFILWHETSLFWCFAALSVLAECVFHWNYNQCFNVIIDVLLKFRKKF